METLLRILRSRRGDLLVDGMIGAVVVGIIFTATVGALLIAGQVSTNNSNNSARIVYLNSQLADTLPRAATVPDAASPTPVKDSVSIMARAVNSVIWREKGAASSVLYARTASYSNDTPANCLTPVSAPDKQSGCLIAAVHTPDSIGGIKIDTIELVPAPGAIKFRTAAPVPTGITELRYLFKVTAAPSASTLKFSSSTSAAVFTVDIPAGGVGNYYGSLVLPATGVGTISLATAGTASYDDTSFLLYEAPQP